VPCALKDYLGAAESNSVITNFKRNLSICCFCTCALSAKLHYTHRLRTCCTTPPTDKLATILQASDHVRVLGVTISSDLSLEKHVSKTCAAGFYWLRQLWRIRRSLDNTSAATLVHAFVTSRVDYCNAVYTVTGAPKTITDKLQRVLNAAARVVNDTKKYDRGLSTLLHDELHWLDVSERVTYKLGVMMYRCLHGQAPRYLADHLTPASEVASRLRLRSANRQQLIVPRCRVQWLK